MTAGTLPVPAAPLASLMEPAMAPPLALPPGIAETPDSRCLLAMLAGLGWQGPPEALLDTLPHAEPVLDLTDVRNALARLGHPTRPSRIRRGQLDARRLPALILRPGHKLAVLRAAGPEHPGKILLFDGATGLERPFLPRAMRGLLFLVEDAAAARPARGSWVAGVARRFRPELPALLGLSAAIAVLGLAVPLFTMLVFDVVVAGRVADPLPLLGLGALVALLGETLFRRARRRALSQIGARLDRLVSDGVFGQLMALPVAMIDRAGPAAQIARLRDFGSIRETLTGPFAGAILDLPALLVVLALLLALGGWIALVPVVALALFLLLHRLSRGPTARAVAAAARAGQAREALAAEILCAQRALRLAGAEQRWADRYAAAAAEAALLSARAAALSGAVAAVSGAIVSLSALAAVAGGAALVLGGAMSPGALVAGMMLIWRVLAPLQAGFAMLGRLDQFAASVRQVDGLMALETERPPPGQTRTAPPLRGDLAFHRVSLRYMAGSEPVLAGVSFAVRHGEVVAITGADGAGKSTLLCLAAGLYRPQGGVVRLGGMDLRAFDPAALRRAVAAVPQRPDLLFGTVAQNLRLGAPAASDAELRRACAAADVLAAIEALPQGFETRLGDNARGGLPRSVLMRLCMARALLRDAPLLLLDEPATGLDEDGAAALERVIALRRGRATILMATQRPSHARLADRVLRLDGGAVEEVRAPGPALLPLFRPAPLAAAPRTPQAEARPA